MANPFEFEPSAAEDATESVSPKKLALKTADRELLKRPSFSFRFQVTIGFLLFFVLCVAIILGSMSAIKRIQRRLHCVQACEQYLFEIEQARRWEKNYFLYGTNLDDALACIRKAEKILPVELDNSQTLFTPQQIAAARQNLAGYVKALEELADWDRAGRVDPARKAVIEKALRTHGAEMIDDAAAQVLKERKAVNQMLDLSRQIPIYSLLALLALLIYTVHLLTQRFMKPLKRLIDNTQRIAHGDFSPLLPMRRYRDEFTMVNVAINRMLEELDGHQTAMVESHKLRAIGTLTAGVAHELNNPLNNIMLTAHSMLEDYQELTETERLEMIRDLIQETDRSQSIVRNLLDFARESECASEPLDLGVLIDETVKLAFNRAKISGATLNVNIQPNLPQIHGDRQQLKQMLLNLILNALDAVTQKGTISIRAEKAFTPGFVAVHVEDNGCGIPEHMLPYIFDPFFTTKAPKQGTGLGLSVSHGIVTKHGGTIKVSSREGVYTRFTVTLPAAGILADQCEVD